MLTATNPCQQPIYRNIFQGNNFPRQYGALYTASRLLHSYIKILNVFFKINFMYLPESGNSSQMLHRKAVLKFFKKLQTYCSHNYLKKLMQICFSLSFTKCFRTPFLQNTYGRLIDLDNLLLVRLIFSGKTLWIASEQLFLEILDTQLCLN